jgi:hypothetical protein
MAMTKAQGWAVCPTCGVVVADVPLHVLWHENPPVTADTPEPDPTTEEDPDGLPA